MSYAIIQTGGKQYKVTPGSEIDTEKLEALPNTKINFAEVLLVVDGLPQVGQPTLPNVQVEAEVLAQIKGPKIRTAVYKSKSRYRRVKGHRQSLTRVKITRIVTREKGEKKSKPKIKQVKSIKSTKKGK